MLQPLMATPCEWWVLNDSNNWNLVLSYQEGEILRIEFWFSHFFHLVVSYSCLITCIKILALFFFLVLFLVFNSIESYYFLTLLLLLMDWSPFLALCFCARSCFCLMLQVSSSSWHWTIQNWGRFLSAVQQKELI